MTLPRYGQPIVRIDDIDLSNLSIAGEAAGDLIQFDGAQWNRLPVGADNDVLVVTAGVPTWSATVTNITLAGTPTVTGNMTFNDNVSILLGTGGAESDLSSNGTNTIWNFASGNFQVQFSAVGGFIYSAGALAFQEGTTISTTAGVLALAPTGDITLRPSGAAQDYNFSDRGNALTLQSQTAGAAMNLDLHSRDGDATDTVGINFFGKGIPTDVSPEEHMFVGWSASGEYQIALAQGGGGSVARDLHISVSAGKDIILGDDVTVMQVKGDSTVTVNGRLLSGSATEIGIQVTNAALTVGTEGSVVIPYRASTAAAGDDAAFGNLNGAIGIQRDTDTGPTDTLEVRANGAWVSVALSGYLMQREVEYVPSPDYWVHPDQVSAKEVMGLSHKVVDESKCVICGKQMIPGDSVVMWANSYVRNHDLHAIFGHPHLEKDPQFSGMETRLTAVEEANGILRGQLEMAGFTPEV